MLDQSFSGDNFRKIIDILNRKGTYLEGYYFPEIETISLKIKDCNKEIKELKKKGLPKEDFVIEINNINEKKELLEKEKETLYKVKLDEIGTKITANSYSINLIKDDDVSQKTVYRTSNRIEDILVHPTF